VTTLPEYVKTVFAPVRRPENMFSGRVTLFRDASTSGWRALPPASRKFSEKNNLNFNDIDTSLSIALPLIAQA
jgi:hypothetical protein